MRDIKNLGNKVQTKAVACFVVSICFIGAFSPILGSTPENSLGTNSNTTFLTTETNALHQENYRDFNDSILEISSEEIQIRAPVNLMSMTYSGWYNKPTSYAQLISWYQELEIAYPNYLQVFKANELYGLGTIPDQNYHMYYVRLTNESLGFHKPEVLFMTNIHGNEYIGPTGAFWFTDWLLRHAFHPNYTCSERDWLRWLLDNREIYIIPSQNPDGYDDNRRTNAYGLDMNRDFDHSRPNPWAAVNSQILRRFIDNHTIRIAVDMHTGYRGLPYSWSNVNYRTTIGAISPISGRNYPGHCPPDFYFLDATYLRVGNYVGDYGGNLYSSNIGPWPYTLGYDADGTSVDWWTGGDVQSNPAEDPYVNDEIYGNYPGCGIMSTLIEYGPNNPANSEYGNDTVNRYGAEVRRLMLHQIDLAQPNLRWLNGTTTNNTIIELNNPLSFKWQVNGSLVVDHTFIQWGRNPDPINHPEYNTTDYDEHAGDYYGGTGWDNALNGNTSGVRYTENIVLNAPGDYYFVAKAKVDQRYKSVIHPEEYGITSYLRIIKERTNESFYEQHNGTDGLEIIDGQLWWYSPVIHVKVISDNTAPTKPNKPSGQARGKVGQTYTYSTSTTDHDGDQVYYNWSWGDGTYSGWIGPFASGAKANGSYTWTIRGTYSIKVKAKDTSGAESNWSDPLPIKMPKNSAYTFLLLFSQILEQIFERFPNAFPILRYLLGFNQ